MPNVLWWSGVLIVLLVVAFAGVAVLKKRLTKPDETMSAGFTLSDLRALHRNGKMSDEEFERAKEAVVSAAHRAAQRQAQQNKPPKSTSDQPPQ